MHPLWWSDGSIEAAFWALAGAAAVAIVHMKAREMKMGRMKNDSSCQIKIGLRRLNYPVISGSRRSYSRIGRLFFLSRQGIESFASG
jgi:hypothetical protein